MPSEENSIPGATFVFYGTVAEDATAGTHIATLTVSPGKGNEFAVLYGRIQNGSTATAQTMTAYITDGTNTVAEFITPIADTAQTARSFPMTGAPVANTSRGCDTALSNGFIVSSGMKLVLQVTTTAVSVTHTFGLVIRCLTGAAPSIKTLADPVGTPTLTSTTAKVY